MSYEIEPHHVISCRTFPQGVCVKCGLVCLNNDFTRWALRVGCNNREHPSYERYRAATHPFKER